MTTVPELADAFDRAWNTNHPFDASYMGVLGFDHLVPDLSEEGQEAWGARLNGMLAEAEALRSDELSDPDRITLGCLVELIEQEKSIVESAEAVQRPRAALLRDRPDLAP
jgi:hypothetical protein